MELRVGRDIRVLLPAFRDHEANRGQWDQTTRVIKDLRAQEETKEILDIKVLLALRQAHRVLKDTKVFPLHLFQLPHTQALRAMLDRSVQLVILDHRVMQEVKVLRVLLVFRDTKGIEVLRVIKGLFHQLLVSRVRRVISDLSHQVLLDILDLGVHRVRLVQSLEHRVTKVRRVTELHHRDRAVNRVQWDQTTLDISVHLDRRDFLVQRLVQLETRVTEVRLRQVLVVPLDLRDTKDLFMDLPVELKVTRGLKVTKDRWDIKVIRDLLVEDRRVQL